MLKITRGNKVCVSAERVADHRVNFPTYLLVSLYQEAASEKKESDKSAV